MPLPLLSNRKVDKTILFFKPKRGFTFALGTKGKSGQPWGISFIFFGEMPYFLTNSRVVSFKTTIAALFSTTLWKTSLVLFSKLGRTV